MTGFAFLGFTDHACAEFVQQMRAVQPETVVEALSALPTDPAALARLDSVVVDCRERGPWAAEIQRLRQTARDGAAPFIIALIANTEAAKAWAVTTGVDDVLLAPFTLLDLHLRVIAMRGAVLQRRELARLVRQTEQFEQEAARYRTLAYTDHLTGLPNRAYLDKWAEMLGREGPERFAFQMLDLDGFKQINDLHGHHVGDLLLKQVGQRISEATRRLDLVVRLGGDEIAIVQVGALGPEDSAAFASRLMSAFRTPFEVLELTIQIGVSIGSALYPADSDDFRELMRRADAAMYAAKTGSSQEAEAIMGWGPRPGT